ncbi:Rok-like winged helix domain-containing protein [Priestia megaterium]|uniref:Rok-like winged helix domain-containing protein n=1 Tax=Priestia megaterium TaxID=1404 RepID=UPI003F65094A
MYLLTSNPNKVFTSKAILEHLYCEVGYNINNFAPVYRSVKELEPNIVQVRRGYYMYKH